MFPKVSGNILGMDQNANRDAAREFVRDELPRSGLTRASLARQAEVDPKTLRSFLDGKRWPHQDTRSRISEALGWAPDEIDHIERTGEHRGSVTYVDRGAGTSEEHPAAISLSDHRTAKLFADTVDFAVHIATNYPLLADRAHKLVQDATDLWSASIEHDKHGEGGDGNAEDSVRGPAPTKGPEAGPANQPATGNVRELKPWEVDEAAYPPDEDESDEDDKK